MPSVDYVHGQNHSHFILTGNMVFDLVGPKTSGARQVVVVGGVSDEGIVRHRNLHLNEGAFTAGGGVRAVASDRVTLGFDARAGWALHLRISAIVGVQLGRGSREARTPRIPQWPAP